MRNQILFCAFLYLWAGIYVHACSCMLTNQNICSYNGPCGAKSFQMGVYGSLKFESPCSILKNCALLYLLEFSLHDLKNEQWDCCDDRQVTGCSWWQHSHEWKLSCREKLNIFSMEALGTDSHFTRTLDQIPKLSWWVPTLMFVFSA